MAGVALVVLRSGVAITIIVETCKRSILNPSTPIEAFVVLVGLCLFLGFLTPYCAALSCLLKVASSRDHCCSKWISPHHVCGDGRFSGGTWARSPLVGRSTVRKKINQDTARTELVNRVRAHSRRQRCFPQWSCERVELESIVDQRSECLLEIKLSADCR